MTFPMMTLIEGIGDELTITVTLFVLLITLVLAWASTRVTEHRLTLTQSQLRGLRVELNELTPDTPSDEEAGSSTESTEVEAEQGLSEDPAVETLVPGGSECVDSGGLKDEHGDKSIRKDNVTENAVETKRDDGRLGGASSSYVQSVGDVRDDIDATGTNQTDRTNTESAENRTSARSIGNISLKIKFLNETERMVQTRIEETVGNFKRINFSEESRDGRVVHLIFNGQFLRDDNRQLGSYSIVNNCVLHCHISQHQQSPGTTAEQPDQADIDLGQFMVPLFACTIGFVWYLRWQYNYMFNTMSTMSLSAVTALFMLAVLAAWRG